MRKQRVRQTVAEHPQATTEDVTDMVGGTVVPVAAHLARLFWDGSIAHLPDQANGAAPASPAPAPHRRNERVPSPDIDAAARALRERAAALEAADEAPGQEPVSTVTELRAAVLRDIADAFEAPSTEPSKQH